MCFSAEASFILGSLLMVIGFANVAQVFLSQMARNQKLACLTFASIPIAFGTQQIAEGFVWLDHLHNQNAIRCFTFFAYPFWPGFIPATMALLELNRPRKREIDPVDEAQFVNLKMFTSKRTSKQRRVLLSVLALTGAGVFGYLMSALILNDPVSAHLSNLRVVYQIRFPMLFGQVENTMTMAVGALYLLVIVGCMFISSVRHSRRLGLAITASLIVAMQLWAEAFASTWCFFAACISSGIFVITKNEIEYRVKAAAMKNGQSKLDHDVPIPQKMENEIRGLV